MEDREAYGANTLNIHKKKNRRKSWKKAALAVFGVCAALLGGIKRTLPDQISLYDAKAASSVLKLAEELETGTYAVTSKLFGASPQASVTVDVKKRMLVPCGQVFGVKFFTKGVIVIGDTDIETESGFINPARLAGLAKNDIIIRVNGKEVNTVEALAEIVESSHGHELAVEYTRNGVERMCQLTPVQALSDMRYRTGIWVRDSTAGIGTMTYYDPENGEFAGLGHGICDVDTGELMPLLRASIVDVSISEIVKGRSGAPGELKGTFDTVQKGILSGNTAFGVYGRLDERPQALGEAMPVGGREQVHEGKACILTDPDGNGVKEYTATLSKVDVRSNGTKCFVVEVTDPELQELTGGIVQGMSGSPILQDGMLIGAVTHVLVNDPTRGYGIFIENMLNAVE